MEQYAMTGEIPDFPVPENTGTVSGEEGVTG